jgi:hypothetical protein
MAIGGEPADVLAGARGEDETDRRHVARCKAPPAEHHVNQRAPRPSVAVRKRVNGLELCVGERRLDQGRIVVGVGEFNEVIEQGGNVLRRWRDVLRSARVEIVPADPVLAVPHHASDLGTVGVPHNGSVNLQQVVQREARAPADVLDRHGHRLDVAEHGVGRGVGQWNPAGARRLYPGEPPGGDLEPLDPRRGDRFGPQQEASERFEVGQSWPAGVQPLDLALGVADVRGDVRREAELDLPHSIGDVRCISARAPQRPRRAEAIDAFPDRLDRPSQPAAPRTVTAGSTITRDNDAVGRRSLPPGRILWIACGGLSAWPLSGPAGTSSTGR